MSIWHDRGMPSGPGGRKPRFNPLVVALPLGALLLFNALTGRIDLTSAFNDNAMDSIRAERARIAATVIAHRTATAAGDQAALTPASITPEAPPTSAANIAPPSCEPSGDERFCLYNVEPGDSLASIASRFGLDGGLVAGWELIFESNQPDLGSMDELLQIGMVLRIPRSNGVVHLLMPGESISGLAVDYDVTSEQIVAANALTDPNHVQIGDIVFIPEPAQLPVDEVVVVADEPEPEPETDESATAEDEQAADDGEEPETPAEADESPSEDDPGDESDTAEEDPSEPTEDPEEERDGPNASEERREDAAENQTPEREKRSEPEGNTEAPEPEPETPAEPAPPEPDDPTRMSWPVVQVKITNYMSARHPLGMDFGLGAAPNSPITAAAAGTVTFAGGDPCCSYGYYVIVDHGNGLQTLYAHFSKISVRKGDVVGRGQTLGIAGDTGNSRGVHLHFEVYKDGKRVDPMLYLPN